MAAAFAAMEKFSDRLRQACRIAGVEWGQTAIAEALGVAKQTADRWMGESMPRADQLFMIADRLQVDARWLATGQGEMRNAANEAQATTASDMVSKRTPLRRTGRDAGIKTGVSKLKKLR